jgi:hypothetical protein
VRSEEIVRSAVELLAYPIRESAVFDPLMRLQLSADNDVAVHQCAGESVDQADHVARVRSIRRARQRRLGTGIWTGVRQPSEGQL